MLVCQSKTPLKKAPASASKGPIKANGLDERKRSQQLINRLQQFDPRDWIFPFPTRPKLYAAMENGTGYRPRFELQRPPVQAQNQINSTEQAARVIDLPPIDELCAMLGLPEIPSSGKLGQAR